MTPAAGSSRWRYMAWTIAACLFLASYLIPAYRWGGLMNDEALVFLQSEDLPTDRFVFLSPGYRQHPDMGYEETLVLYTIRLLQHMLGPDLVYIRLLYACTLILAGYYFFQVIKRCYSEGYAALGVIFLAGSAYTGFYNRVLHRNGASFVWTCLIIWILYNFVVCNRPARRRTIVLVWLPIALTFSLSSYTSFQFLTAAVYCALLVWAFLYMPRKRDVLYIVASGLVTLILFSAVIALGGESIGKVISRGEYVLIGGVKVKLLLSNIFFSFLIPVYYMESGNFLVDMTHLSFHRHALSYILTPFFVWGIASSLMGRGDKSGFQRLICIIWIIGTILIATGGPVLKHHYALFPLVILISVHGLHECRERLVRRLSSRVITFLAGIVVVIFLWSEMRHLFRVIPGSGLLHQEIDMPHAMAQEALESAQRSSQVYIIENYTRDTIHYYTRHVPNIHYYETDPGQLIERKIIADLEKGQTVCMVLSGHTSYPIFSKNGVLGACFDRLEKTLYDWPITVYRSRSIDDAMKKRLGGQLAGQKRRKTPAAALKAGMGEGDRLTPSKGGAISADSNVGTGKWFPRRLFSRWSADTAPREGAAQALTHAGASAAPGRVGILQGGEGGSAGEYKEPRGIAMDSKGNLYVADFRNFRIQKFGADGYFIKAWGKEGKSPGQFDDPCGVAVGGDGKVYVADTFNDRIEVFDADGKFLLCIEGGLYAPRDVAVDQRGRIWVADSANSLVKIFSSDGKQLKEIGRKGRGKGEFDSPNSIALDRKGKVYVADAGNRRVQICDEDGNYLSEFRVDGWEAGFFNEPYLDVDGAGDIYLTDPRGQRALRYSAKGKLVGVLKPVEGSAPLLQFPMGIAVDKEGQAVYIVDCRNNRIRKFLKHDFK